MAENVVQPVNEQIHDARNAEESAGASSALVAIGSVLTGALDVLWRLLRRPWLLVVAAALLLLTQIALRVTPQIPGQLLESPVETTRWVNSAAANWGGIGGATARALQLYNLYDAPWFVALVALAALLAAVQLADAVGQLLAWRRIPRQLNEGAMGEPAAIGGEEIARVRFAASGNLANSEMLVSAAITENYKVVESAEVPPERVISPDSVTAEAPAKDAGTPYGETRMLARRNGWSSWLRPLLPAAVLVASLLFWANMLWAWNVQTDPLPPEQSFTSQTRNLAVRNLVTDDGAPVIEVTYRGETREIPADGSAARVGDIAVRAESVAPAMVVSTDAPLLAMPGRPNPQERVGLTFALPGSEQFVVLPGEGIGIRFVRVAEEEGVRFVAEVYDEEGVQPLMREEIASAGALRIPLGEEEIVLDVTPMWSVSAHASRTFAAWMWLPLLALALAGLFALIWPATFLLAQLSPWEEQRTQVILQGSRRSEVDALRLRLSATEETQPA